MAANNERRSEMKVLSSVMLGVGLLLPVLSEVPAGAADAPASESKAAQPGKGSAPKSAAKTPPAKAAPAKAAAPVPAAPAAPAVVLEPDGVAFGMSAEDVAKLYDRWWDKQFIAKYQKTNPGPKTRELDFELAEQKKVLRRVAIFDGRSTSFDKAEFHEEFAHGSSETMTSSKLVRRPPGDSKEAKEAKGVAYTRRFFFFQDKLWKIYDEYRLDAASPLGADFKEATARVESTLGKTAKKTRPPESQFESVMYDAGSNRVRLVKLGTDRAALVRIDSALAKEVLDRRAQQAKTPESTDLDDDIQAVIR
jgi:hypothetical protein